MHTLQASRSSRILPLLPEAPGGAGEALEAELYRNTLKTGRARSGGPDTRRLAWSGGSAHGSILAALLKLKGCEINVTIEQDVTSIIRSRPPATEMEEDQQRELIRQTIQEWIDASTQTKCEDPSPARQASVDEKPEAASDGEEGGTTVAGPPPPNSRISPQGPVRARLPILVV